MGRRQAFALFSVELEGKERCSISRYLPLASIDLVPRSGVKERKVIQSQELQEGSYIQSPPAGKVITFICCSSFMFSRSTLSLVAWLLGASIF